jgi:hypothetical protein
VVKENSYKIYLVNFGHSYKFLQILEVWTTFCHLKQLEKQIINITQCRASNRPMACDRKWPVGGGTVACHARLADKPVEPWPGGPVQPRRRPMTRSPARWRAWRRRWSGGGAHPSGGSTCGGGAGCRPTGGGRRRGRRGFGERWGGGREAGKGGTGAVSE